MWTAFSVKLRTLSVLACPFPASRVNGVGTGFESPTDKIPTNSSTCFGAGRYENRVSLHCVLLCNARHALGLEHTQHVIKFVQRAVVTFSKEIVSVKTAPTSLLSHCMQQKGPLFSVFRTSLPTRTRNEFPDDLVFWNVLRRASNRHNPRQRPWPRDAARETIKRMAAGGGVAANTSSCLLASRT